MNKRGHVLNGLLLAIGLGYILEPSGTVATFEKIVEVTVPVVLGALFPDVDTAFGKHRKTLHNLPVLGAFYAFPLVYGNLNFVWIGVFTHYVLDLMGSKRGIALFYPYTKEYDLPIGVSTSSKWASWVTVGITAFELAVIYVIVKYDLPVGDLGTAVQSFGI